MTRRAIVYAINYAPEIAGAGRCTGELGEFLAGQGVDVTVVTTPPHYPGWTITGDYSTFGFTSENLAGVHVIRCPLLLRKPMQGIWRMLAPLSFAVTSAPAFVWQVLRKRPDTIICVEPTLFVTPLALLMAKLTGARSVLHVQDLEVEAAFAMGHLEGRGLSKRVGEMFDRFIVRRFKRVVTIGDRMSEKLLRKGVNPRRLSIVRNWVDLDHIKPMAGPSPYRAELGIPDGTVVGLYSGNIGVKQGLDVLLEAVARVCGKIDMTFVIAGEGPAKQALMDRFGALPNIRFLPFQPYERLGEFLALADLHLLPQQADVADLVLPSKLGGMLASGKPILVTAQEGTELAAFLKDAAVIVPPGDAIALAAAMERFVTNPEEAGTAESRLRLARRLSKPEALAQFESLLFETELRAEAPATAAPTRVIAPIHSDTSKLVHK
ncbi:WcaI family glycosyltransferase [Chthonobacter albigriseus]|uniref:WcaI family glycosyltransferase n=1 Tax=Chthonobacter albigriseus TaxID=1683161 RepID=UPI0015EEE220|nr:WcaI family glycosyltransferase [Chthonobacter albigriseus]